MSLLLVFSGSIDDDIRDLKKLSQKCGLLLSNYESDIPDYVHHSIYLQVENPSYSVHLLVGLSLLIIGLMSVFLQFAKDSIFAYISY